MRGALPAAPGRFCCANRSVDGPSPKYPRAAAIPPKKLRRETSWLMDPPEKVDERNYAILTRTAGSGLASFDDGQNCRFPLLAGLVVGLRARRAQKRAQFRACRSWPSRLSRPRLSCPPCLYLLPTFSYHRIA